MPSDTAKTFSTLLAKLHKDRERHAAAIDEIDAVLGRMGGAAPGRARKGTRGRRSGGRRVQGVKEALLAALSKEPQTPADLKKKVSRKVGASVNITTQLHMLKREKKAKSAGRGKWVRA